MCRQHRQFNGGAECYPIATTPAQEKCLCDAAAAIAFRESGKIGPVQSGFPTQYWQGAPGSWSGTEYNAGFQSCQDFTNALLNYCNIPHNPFGACAPQSPCAGATNGPTGEPGKGWLDQKMDNISFGMHN